MSDLVANDNGNITYEPQAGLEGGDSLNCDVKKKGILEADMMTANPLWHYVIFVVVFVLSDLLSTATLYSDVSFAAMYRF